MLTSTLHLGIFYMPQIYDMGRWLYFPSEGRHAEDFPPLKILMASAGFERHELGYLKAAHNP
jgi:hypothetical protein